MNIRVFHKLVFTTFIFLLGAPLAMAVKVDPKKVWEGVNEIPTEAKVVNGTLYISGWITEELWLKVRQAVSNAPWLPEYDPKIIENEIKGKRLTEITVGLKFKVKEVVLNSGGGSVDLAYILSVHINWVSLPVRVQAAGYCLSACVYILSSAHLRLMPSSALLLVHIPRPYNRELKRTCTSQEIRAALPGDPCEPISPLEYSKLRAFLPPLGPEIINKFFEDKDTYLDAKEALAFDLIDRIAD